MLQFYVFREGFEKGLSLVKHCYIRLALKGQSYRRLEGTINNQITNSDIGHMRYLSIDLEDIQKVINNLNKKRYSHSTIKKTYDFLNDFFKYVSARDKIGNPMLLVSMPTKTILKQKQKL